MVYRQRKETQTWWKLLALAIAINPCVSCSVMQLLSRTAWFAQLHNRGAPAL